jgi:hypothetical protein
MGMFAKQQLPITVYPLPTEQYQLPFSVSSIILLYTVYLMSVDYCHQPLPTEQNQLLFSVSVCSRQTEVSRFRFQHTYGSCPFPYVVLNGNKKRNP